MDNNTQQETYTLADYLQGAVSLTISEDALKRICYGRGVEMDKAVSDCTEKERDLTTADLYMYCAAMPTTSASVDDKNGTWEHKEGSATMSGADKKHMRKMAEMLYRKWGILPTNMSSIRFGSQGTGMRRHGK